MQNICPNPTCGAMYNLTPQHIGRSFACKKCGAALVVTAAGLEITGPLPPPGEPPPSRFGGAEAMAFPGDDAGGRMEVGSNVGAFFSRLGGRLRDDAATWSFAAGAFFVVICLFFPLLDRAKVLRRQVKVDAGDRREKRLNDELRRKERELQAKGESLEKLEKEKEERDKAFKRWQEEERPKLQDEVDEAQDAERTWRYWYDVGMMWGFLFLSFASLGYLTPQQTTIRRVVGSIVICAMILFIFIRFVFIEAAR